MCKSGAPSTLKHLTDGLNATYSIIYQGTINPTGEVLSGLCSMCDTYLWKASLFENSMRYI